MNLHFLSGAPAAARTIEQTRRGKSRQVSLARLPIWIADGMAVARQHALWWLAVLLICADFATLLELAPRLRVLAPLVAPLAAGVLVLMQERASRARAWSLREAFAEIETHRTALAAVGLGTVALLALGYLVQLAAFHLNVTPVGTVQSLRGVSIVFDARHEAGRLYESLAGLPFLALGLAAFWFAPALIVLRGYGPVDAMVTSLRAVLLNWRVALVYALAIAADWLIAPVVPTLVRGLLVTPLVSAFIVLTMYGSFRDVFGDR
jgi:uncharacterized membrane protein